MASVSSNNFSQAEGGRCLPAIGTSIDSCGTMTRCDIATATPALLNTIFGDGTAENPWRDMSSLLATQMELKACGIKRNGLYDFLMANARPVGGKNLTKRNIRGSDSLIEPFILANQKSIVNNDYWAVKAVGVSAEPGADYYLDLYSRDSIPSEIAWFNERDMIYLFGMSGAGGTGSAIRSAFKVVTSELQTTGGTACIRVHADQLDGGSFMGASKKFSGALGAGAVVVRGAPNVQDVERYCNQAPAINPNKAVPFWFEWNRYSMCTDSEYEKMLLYLIKNNAYFAKYGDVTIAERNRQLAADFQRRWINNFMWGKAISSNQTLALYRNLEVISSYGDTGGLYLPYEGRCMGLRANAIGVYEQLTQCGQVKDLQGENLNLLELFDALYNIRRSRGNQGNVVKSIDIVMDSVSAFNFHRGMIRYYDEQYEGLARFNISTDGKNEELGFMFTSYKLLYPKGLIINVITDDFFDDFATYADAEGVTGTGKFMWILDLGRGIYPGIIGSNRVVHRTGDVNDAAKVDQDWACVMSNPTREISMNSIGWTGIVDCPSDNLWIENFSDEVPEHAGRSGDYEDVYGNV